MCYCSVQWHKSLSSELQKLWSSLNLRCFEVSLKNVPLDFFYFTFHKFLLLLFKFVSSLFFFHWGWWFLLCIGFTLYCSFLCLMATSYIILWFPLPYVIFSLNKYFQGLIYKLMNAFQEIEHCSPVSFHNLHGHVPLRRFKHEATRYSWQLW